MGLHKDEFGFVRAAGYGRTRQVDLRAELGALPDDEVYQASTSRGARTSKAVTTHDVNYSQGDTFSLGPKVTKAALPAQLVKEWRALQRSGYGSITEPHESTWGYAIELYGFALPSGVRTNAMVLLPKDYPTMPPIGFYIHQNGLAAAKANGIDLQHLFPDKTFYGAPNFAQSGWAWFCLKFQPWRPGRYTLISIVMMVTSVIAEGVKR